MYTAAMVYDDYRIGTSNSFYHPGHQLAKRFVDSLLNKNYAEASAGKVQYTEFVDRAIVYERLSNFNT
jgi:hypothetical protein